MRTMSEKLAASLHEVSVYGIGATSDFNQRVIVEAAKESEWLRAAADTARQAIQIQH